MGVQDPVHLARERAADHVADGEGPAPAGPRRLDAGQRVQRLPRLADGHDQRAVVDDGVAVAELRAVIHLHRDPAQLLDHELPDQGRVPGGAAGDQDHLAHLRQGFVQRVHPLEEDLSRILREPTADRVPHGARLLVDLLQHEMLVAALLRQDGAPSHRLDGPLNRLPRQRRDLHSLLRENHHLSVVQEQHVPGVAEDGRDVGGEKEIPVPQTDHQGALALRPHDPAGVAFPQDADGVGAPEVVERAAHRHLDVRLLGKVFLDQVGDDLGVRLGAEAVPLRDQLLLEAEIVLDDPVVDHDQVAGAVRVRVGVLLGGPPVRRPAGMPETDRPDQVGTPDGVLQLFDLAHRPVHHHPPLLQHGQPGGIVAPVLQPLQPVQQDRYDLLVSDVPDDTAHG